MKGYIKVLFPVVVPDSPYCWEHSSTLQTPICDCFDNAGGHSFCNLFNESLRGNESNQGVKKLEECARLKEPDDIEYKAKQQYFERLRQERDEHNTKYAR